MGDYNSLFRCIKHRKSFRTLRNWIRWSRSWSEWDSLIHLQFKALLFDISYISISNIMSWWQPHRRLITVQLVCLIKAHRALCKKASWVEQMVHTQLEQSQRENREREPERIWFRPQTVNPAVYIVSAKWQFSKDTFFSISLYAWMCVCTQNHHSNIAIVRLRAAWFYCKISKRKTPMKYCI